MRRYTKIFFISIVAVLAIATVYIHFTYLYNPVNYPNGNLYPIKWYEFVKPLDIECFSWSEKGDQAIYEPSQNDETEVKYIVDGFAKMEAIEDYNSEKYYSHLPEVRGKEYTMLVRQVKSRDSDGKANGNILLQFSFLENDNIAVIDGVRFYKMSDEYKKHIIEKYSVEQQKSSVKTEEWVIPKDVNTNLPAKNAKHDYLKEAHLPPTDWNPLTATDEELGYYKYPPKPMDSKKLTAWKKTVTGGWYDDKKGSIPVHSHPCIPCEIVWNNQVYEVDSRCGPINGIELDKDNDGATVYEIPGIDSSYGIILGFGTIDGHRATRIDYDINDALASVFLDSILFKEKLDNLEFPHTAIKIKTSVNLSSKTDGRKIPVELETKIEEKEKLVYIVTFTETWDSKDFNNNGITQPIGKHYWRFKVVPNSYNDLDSVGDIPPQQAKAFTG